MKRPHARHPGSGASPRKRQDGPAPSPAPKMVAPMASRVRFSVLRRDDFLALDLELVNMRLATGAGTPATLVRDDPAADALLIAHFPPQHLAEETFSGTSLPNPAPRRRARLAGPSRLVFAIPTGIDEIPCTLAALLDWSRLTPVVAPAALPPGTRPDDIPPDDRPAPSPPGQGATAIEAPYRLVLSPDATARWRHDVDASPGTTGIIPLWHTLLVPGDDGAQPTVRAVWTRDLDAPGIAPTYPISLSDDDRQQIITLSADFTIPGYTPLPIGARRLALTSLGAWLDLAGQWDVLPATIVLEAWLHRATMGRDQAVVVVERGNLSPYGHRASKVTVTRREFLVPEGLLDAEAVLVQETFIVPRERVRAYESLPAADQRGTPFRRVEILTTISPPINTDEREIAFWPRARADFEDVRFELLGVDWDGVAHQFTTPLLFVGDRPEDHQQVDEIFAEGPATRRVTPFDGQLVAFAAHRDPGDTTLPAQTISHGARWTNGPGAPFFPVMKEAAVRVRALEQLAQGGPTPRIAYNTVYLGAGLDGGNANEVFADLVGPPPKLDLRADQAGGLAVPRIEPTVLSRRLGPVGGDPTAIAQGQLPDPAGFLKQALGPSKLLGVISLADLIAGDGADPMAQVPRLRSIEQGGKLVSTLEQTAELKGGGILTLRTTLSAPLPGQGAGEPTYATDGEITNLSLDLIPDVAEVMRLDVARLHFASGSGRKPTFEADVRDVAFSGALAFLNELRSYLGDSLAAPPAVDVTPAGVRITYTVGLPTIAVGFFSLQNVAITAGLELPFSTAATDTPVRLRFAFCERHRPFLLTVALFGGGGFVALELTPKGIALLEASLEFGASVALNLGVASGRVEVMAGIYFRLELQGSDRGVQLTGYFRCGGSLEVLSLIRISAEFYLGLTWKDPKAWGMARLTVEVEVAFFSTSVSLEVERQFSGSSADPPFSALVSPDDWETYLAAFA